MDRLRRLLGTRLLRGRGAQPRASEVIGLVLVIALASGRVTGEPVGMPDPPVFAVVGVIAYGVTANVLGLNVDTLGAPQ